MPAKIIAVILCCLLALSSCRNKEKHPAITGAPATGNVKIKIPNDWIDRIYKYNNSDDNNDAGDKILADFAHFIAPDTLTGSSGNNIHGTFNPIFVNLDEEPGEELICLCSYIPETDMVMAVFKKTGTDWYLIYTEHFNTFYNQPDLYIANNNARNKTFYHRSMSVRGSGIYSDSYIFYKLIKNKVYRCLELVNEAHISGWGLYLNQSAETKFRFNSIGYDGLDVTFDYEFYTCGIYSDSATEHMEDEYNTTLVKEKTEVYYKWNDTSYTYEPENNQDSSALTPLKIASISTLGDDSLFIQAFGYELHHILTDSPLVKKNIVRQYLAIADTQNHVTNPNGALEEKADIGGMKFYGPKTGK